MVHNHKENALKSLTRYNRLTTFFAVALVLGSVGDKAQAQPAVQAWVQRHSGPSLKNDFASAIVADGSGNVIVTGSAFNASGSNDCVTIKYSNAGVPLWTNRSASLGTDYLGFAAVAVDGNGDVFVAAPSARTNSSQADYATMKYSSAGVPLWTNLYHGTGTGKDINSIIAVDTNGDVIVTGYAGSSGSEDYATIKYSSAGVPLWTNRYNGPGSREDKAHAMAVDGGNNVFVTGHSASNSSPPYNNDYATIKYSSDGVPLWTNRYNGPGNSDDQAWAIAVDDNGDVFVTGTSTGSGSGYDYATIKYSGAGVPLWTNRYNGPANGTDVASIMAVDKAGNVIVTGYSTLQSTLLRYLTIKYSGAGVPLWTNSYRASGSFSTASAVAVDTNGNVYVTGGSDNDYATIKYSSAGIPLWTNRYNGPANGDDNARAIAVDGSGNVFVAGDSTGSSSGQDYTTVKYVVPPSLAGLGFTNGQFGFNISGPSGSSVAIQASTNLQNWVSLVTNILIGGTNYFSDPQPTDAKSRFYRVRLLP